MRCLKRNQTKFWYCLYKNDRIPGDTATPGDAVSGTSIVGDDEENINYVIDENGNHDGEIIPNYAEPILMLANISPATGQANVEQFGNLEDYDKVIVTDDTACPIDEDTVLFVDKEPEFNDDNEPMFDYIVKRVSKSLNSVSIAISKVKVS